VTERVVNTILAEMDGLEELQSIVLIGATNRPNLVDPALLRPGRFDELVYVGVPSAEGRERILGIHTQRMPLADDVDLAAIAERADRFTGADLEDLVRRAGLNAIRSGGQKVDKVTAEHFEQALEDSRASVTEKMEDEYKKMRDELKQRAVEIQPFGFVSPGMLTPTRDAKHED
jgi:transitional endoplasmic reticulum ATPase